MSSEPCPQSRTKMEFKTPDIQTSDSPLWTTWEGHQLLASKPPTTW